MAEVPYVKDVKFDPLQIPHIPPQLRLPMGIDTDDAYALFSLFWPESMWNIITTNTNIYAVQKRLHFTVERQYPWHDTYIAEIKIFFGILIYMGLHKESEEAQYWHQNLEQGPLHSYTLYMSRYRYQATKRYLHVALALDTNAYKDKEEEMKRTWWYKVEPLASILRTAYAKYYISYSSVSIDKLMIRCFRRSIYIYKMPNKLIT
jgi:Transposase IS4